MPIDLVVPAVGESVTEIFIGKWYKAEGDTVQADEGLVEVESEKATLDVPAPASGVLVKILKQAGESAEVGEIIAQIDTAAASHANRGAARAPETQPGNGADGAATSRSAEPAPSKPARTEGASISPPVTPPSPREKWIIRQEPSPSQLSRQEAAIEEEATRHQAGSPSESGAVVSRAARQEEEPDQPEKASASSPAPAASSTLPTAAPAPEPTIRQGPIPQPVAAAPSNREEETVPLSPIRRRIAARLVEAQHNAALLTTFNEIDMTVVKQLRKEHGEAFLKRHGVKLGFMSFFVKATIEALRQCPELNAMIKGDSIVYRRYYDIGVAIGSERGLVVPVLRNAEAMTFAEVEKAIEDFAKRAQSSELRVEELQGGTFTISNGGVYGSLLSTPIVNPPQSGVLGMHSIQDRPVAVEGHIQIRPMMYVALSYDHRIVDGREAVTFLRRIKEVVESPTRMLLDV